MFACVCMYVYVCLRVCMIFVRMYVCLYVCMYIFAYVCMFARMYVCMFARVYVCIRMFAFVCVCEMARFAREKTNLVVHAFEKPMSFYFIERGRNLVTREATYSFNPRRFESCSVRTTMVDL